MYTKYNYTYMCRSIISYVIKFIFFNVVLNTYKMNIKTNLLEECVNFVDNTKKRNRELWKCTIMLVFILTIIIIIIFRYGYIHLYD